ncbi:TIGR04222 domain-containing membrane protein [Actinokineospora cianjurensis]|uniref:Uncharacterized protein (TIGR04222 family) n=1 Tax=Actinokineospora cianjurensis TaxID=585224 RepID=A0A421BBB8_9PSEU|nr:TIGR04222 domain-containing membrane protein [Actinokineospora cianjurensis]RLK61646.1 uncharacterized protein (TIGR04222 family) [Actinokineospora cianjurensis]
MDRPWGVSGPDFLRLYLVAIAFAALLAAAVRIKARGGRVEGQARLSVEELAYLAGGARRVVELAITRLLDKGKLRATRDGRLSVVSGTKAGKRDDEVDAAVLRVIQQRGHGSTWVLVSAVAGRGVVTAIGAALARQGLVVGGRRRWARRSALPMAVVAAVGVARWVGEVGGESEPGWLTLAVIGAIGLAVLIASVPVPERTYAGERVLRETRQARRTGSPTADQYVFTGSVGVVVFAGLAGHPDETVARFATASRTHSTADGSSGAYSAGCGGGDSGGHSGGCGGGGGCGGCGGGGGV